MSMSERVRECESAECCAEGCVVQVRVVLDAGVRVSFGSACAVVNVAVVYAELMTYC
jgi:hypothetical protein